MGLAGIPRAALALTSRTGEGDDAGADPVIDSLPYLVRIVLTGSAIVGAAFVAALSGLGWWLAGLYVVNAFDAPLYRRVLAFGLVALPLVLIAGYIAVRP